MSSRDLLVRQSSPKASLPVEAKHSSDYFSATEETEVGSPAFAYSLKGVRIFAEGEDTRISPAQLVGKPLPSPVQAKLVVGPVNDPVEHEADRVADEVTRMPAPGGSIAAAPPQLSRRCVAGEKKEELQQKPPAPATVHKVLRSPGQPLDAATRAFFEPRLGCDFSHVRVHTDGLSSQSAEAVAARAYTVGSDIAFRQGEYAPDTNAGRRLLAHELVHTLQQRITPAPARIFRQPIPGWNFTPADYAKLQGSGKNLTMAPDSSFFPANLKDNLLKTLAYVLGPKISPPATEGINAIDFFHGHLVIKKDPATAKQAKAEAKKGRKLDTWLTVERNSMLGRRVGSEKYPLTQSNLGANQQAVEKVLHSRSFSTLLEEASQVPGAAMMYHTFEFNQPSDLKAKGQKLGSEDPRRHYVTPLDTNNPMQYTPPSDPLSYEKEYTVVTGLSFLVDDKGAVHVRPFSTTTGFTTLELSTITGTTFPEPFEREK